MLVTTDIAADLSIVELFDTLELETMTALISMVE